MRLVRLACALVFSLSVSSLAAAQNLGTGLYAFSSFDNRGFDSVNLGNLNTHFEIPIVAKQGRGLNFDYSIVYDGLMWSTALSGGTQYWQPRDNWGFYGQLLGGSTGFLSYSQLSVPCPRPPNYSGPVPNGIDLINYVYHDPFGRSHRFNYSLKVCVLTDTGNGTVSGNGSSSDGSGYFYDLNDNKVHNRTGAIIDPPQVVNATSGGQASGTITDSNGNTITNNGNGTFTDTLGVTALNITGSGTAASPLALTYPVTSQADGAASASASVTYRTYTVQTNFGCSGISEYGATSVDLTDKITLADGSIYSFSYEPTTGVSGAVTGRLASVTLPAGGIINYSYTGGCNGSGINSDGTVGILTRTQTDGPRSYARAPINSNATTTTLQDEKGNQTYYQFTEVGDFFYETHRQVYQGAVGGTLLMDQSTCYNGAQPPCDGGAITLPIISTIALSSYNGGTQAETDNIYTASGFLTSSTQKGGGSTLQSTAITYNSVGGVLSSKTSDGSGNIVASSTYGYDESAPTATSGIPQHAAASGSRGNQTSAQVFTKLGPQSNALDTTTIYYDTGVPVSTTTPNGTTKYSYDSTQTFVTGTTLPTPSSGVQLATSASYDQQSGVLISTAGMNSGQTMQVKQYDRLLRPTVMALPNGGQITYSYSLTQTGVAQTTGNGPNADTETQLDMYGRTSRVAVYNGLTSNGWYQVDYCYDSTGLLKFQSTSYQGTGFIATKQCSGNGTSYVYDALGRMTSSSNADGTTSYQYTNRAVLKTDVNGVKRITQYDLLGRTLSVCEVSSNANMPGSGSPVTCGMDIAGTGFVTSYSYDLFNHMTTIAQGTAQQRVFQTDAAGRPAYTSEPERGTTTYSYAYNGTGLVVTRTRPKANQTSATARTTTTTQYDSLNRIASVSYSDGTPTKNFFYDNNPFVSWSSESTTNLKGNLGVSATTSSSGTLLTSSLFSYDSMGHVTTMWQCAPSICGTTSQTSRPALTFGYDLAGNLTSEFDGASGSISYGRSPAGEVTSVTNQSYTNVFNTPKLVSNVVNGPNGPISYTLGNGLNIYKQYDSSGRFFAQWVCTGTAASNCNTQLYGTDAYRSGVRVTAMDDTTQGASRSFGYDEFNRLTSATRIGNTTQSNFSYSYDRYGNRWSQTVTQGSGPAPSVTFDSTSNRITSSGYGYDAAGNLTSDGLGHTYTYDAEGNLITVDNGSTAQYVYNALNQRVSVAIAGSGGYTNEFLFDYAGRITSTWQAATNSGNEGRIYWDGQPIAYRAYDGTTYFQHQDILGTERMRTNYAGAVAASFGSLPFGDGYSKNIGFTWADQDGDHFAQQQYDSESNTDHAQFRQYSSTQGRWMSPDPYDGSYDPSDPQSLNRYSYVGNNPLSYIDPLGLVKPCTDAHGEPCQTGGGGAPPPTCSFFCFGIGSGPTPPQTPPPTGPGGGGGGTATNNGPPKSPARQSCEREAQQKYSQAKTAALNGAGKGFLIGGGVTAGVQGVAGCAVGAAVGGTIGAIATIIIGGEGAFGGAPVGCVVGGVSAVLDGLPQSVLVGTISGGISYFSDTSAAGRTLQQDLQACSRIP